MAAPVGVLPLQLAAADNRASNFIDWPGNSRAAPAAGDVLAPVAIYQRTGTSSVARVEWCVPVTTSRKPMPISPPVSCC